jgi:hypothetical protein
MLDLRAIAAVLGGDGAIGESLLLMQLSEARSCSQRNGAKPR